MSDHDNPSGPTPSGSAGAHRAEQVAEAEAAYREVATELLAALDDTLTGWIVRILHERLPADWPPERRAELAGPIDEVARSIHAEVGPRLQALLTADVDDQRLGPLGVLRAAVAPANRMLSDAGVPTPRRDPVSEEMFPDDPYDLSPANFADVDPDLHELGLIWGAAKAHVVLARRPPPERR